MAIKLDAFFTAIIVTSLAWLLVPRAVRRRSASSVGVRILNLGMDTQTPTGKLMLTVLGAIAQFEREMMLERQREGIAQAKSEGRYNGRKPIEALRRDSVFRLAAEGSTRAAIAAQLGVGVGEATVYRILASAKAQTH